jgi:ubiquinone biosynthesis protein
MGLGRGIRGVTGERARRATHIAQVGARYGFGYIFGQRLVPFRRQQQEPGRIGVRMRLAIEELGPNFAELGRFLGARGDIVPPDVARELKRAETTVEPVPFARLKPRVERELGNYLDRLFLEFDERPVRAGVLTQSHQAVLPGGRPALVVVSKAGVRGDILAMRPVAELVRRRQGDRLPANPNEIVTEFTAHVNHRRDMHFAGQTARRLADLEDLPLRIPDFYRDYSAARVITLETPATGKPVPREVAGILGDALVRLALVEGIYFADLAPERFLLSGREIWLADPTESFAIDPERMRGIAEVLAAVRRGDVGAIGPALRLSGCHPPKDMYLFNREMRETLGFLGGPLWREHSMERIVSRVLESFRRGHVRLSPDLAGMMAYLVEVEELVRGYDPKFSGTRAAERAVEALISRYRDPQYLISRTARRLSRLDTYADYPRQIHSVLNELRDGEIEVKFRHQGLNNLISKVDILANRLVFALLIAALIVGSSLIGIFGESDVRFLGINIFGLIGFTVAAVFGLLLLIGIIRSGRL